MASASASPQGQAGTRRVVVVDERDIQATASKAQVHTMTTYA